MVEFIICDFESVRGGGNIKSDVPTINDFILENCTLEESGNEGEFILSAGISDVDSVNLSVSSGTVTIGGTVTLTAIVLDDEEDPLENKHVVFKTGSDIVGTGTTNSSGIATYTMTMNNYGTFTCTASCSGVTSTAVVVIVNRIVPTISLAAVSSTITVGDSPQLTGTLSVGSGAYVRIIEGSTLVDTVITGVDGAFSYTGSATSSTGTLTFKAVSEGDSTYSSVESSSVTITVSGGTPVVDSVSLSSDKSVLSAYDSESAVLSATVLDDSSNPMSGETVSFDIVDSGTVVENIGTAQTNSSGVATVSYYAKASGDLYIQATCSQISSSSILVEDCSYYNTAEVTRSSTNGSTIYDNNLSQALPSKCEISFDMYSNNSTDGGEHRFFLLPKTQYSSGTTQPSYGIYIDALKTKMNIGKRENGSTVGLYPSLAYSSGSYRNFKILKDGTDLTFYIDGDMIGTSTTSWIGNYSDYCLSMIRWTTSGTSKIRNVKFKSL